MVDTQMTSRISHNSEKSQIPDDLGSFGAISERLSEESRKNLKIPFGRLQTLIRRKFICELERRVMFVFDMEGCFCSCHLPMHDILGSYGLGSCEQNRIES